MPMKWVMVVEDQTRGIRYSTFSTLIDSMHPEYLLCDRRVAEC